MSKLIKKRSDGIEVIRLKNGDMRYRKRLCVKSGGSILVDTVITETSIRALKNT